MKNAPSWGVFLISPQAHNDFPFSQTMDVFQSVTRQISTDLAVQRTASASPFNPEVASAPRARPATRSPRRVTVKWYCIRCGDAAVESKPLCGTCYTKWSVYKNPEYVEKHCHSCGERARTSMDKPLCKACYAG